MVNLKETRAQLDALAERYLAEEAKILEKLDKKERIAIGKPVKTITSTDTFTANGNKYYVLTSLSVNRFEEFESLQAIVGFGVSFQQLFNQERKAYDLLNEGRPADAAVILYNSMNGIKNHLEDRTNPILQMCALFICREGEDASTWNQKLADEKINDWKKEGISMESFFQLAFNSVQGFMPAYNQVSQSISAKVEKVRKGSPKV